MLFFVIKLVVVALLSVMNSCLSLSENPLRFEPLRKMTTIFYDDKSNEVSSPGSASGLLLYKLKMSNLVKNLQPHIFRLTDLTSNIFLQEEQQQVVGYIIQN